MFKGVVFRMQMRSYGTQDPALAQEGRCAGTEKFPAAISFSDSLGSSRMQHTMNAVRIAQGIHRANALCRSYLENSSALLQNDWTSSVLPDGSSKNSVARTPWALFT